MAKSKKRSQSNRDYEPQLKMSYNNPVIKIVTVAVVFALVATLAVSMFGSSLTGGL